jgi:hypothetical protein
MLTTPAAYGVDGSRQRLMTPLPGADRDTFSVRDDGPAWRPPRILRPAPASTAKLTR